MKFLPSVCLLSLGAIIGTGLSNGNNEGALQIFGLCFLLSGLAWKWPQITRAAHTVRSRVMLALTGRPQPSYPTTDPAALAAEIVRINAQMSQLHETAIVFDDSFSQTLRRLDERLRRIEQQTTYIQNNS